MKKYILVTISFIFLFALDMNAQERKADRDYFTIMVDGLGCPFCAYGLEKKFKSLKDLKDVKIDMETGEFNFSFPSSKEMTLEQVEVQVDAAGYSPLNSKVERSDGSIEESKQEVQEFVLKGNLVEDVLEVNGKCDMCKGRIERTSYRIRGVKEALWDKKSKTLKIVFDDAQTSAERIAMKIAERGYDNEIALAEDEAYKMLPPCCKYKRAKKSK